MGRAFCVVIFIPFLKNAVSCKMTFTQNYLYPQKVIQKILKIYWHEISLINRYLNDGCQCDILHGLGQSLNPPASTFTSTVLFSKCKLLIYFRINLFILLIIRWCCVRLTEGPPQTKPQLFSAEVFLCTFMKKPRYIAWL